MPNVEKLKTVTVHSV